MQHPLLPHMTGYIAGRFLPASTGPTLWVRDPATGETLATLPEYGEAEANAAVDAAAADARAEMGDALVSAEKRAAQAEGVVEQSVGEAEAAQARAGAAEAQAADAEANS